MTDSSTTTASRPTSELGKNMSETIPLFFAASGGGVQKAMVGIAGELVARRFGVDVILPRADGPYLSQLPAEANVIELGTKQPLSVMSALVRYLRRTRPKVLLSAQQHTNLAAIWARQLSRVPVRVVISQHNHLSLLAQHDKRTAVRLLPRLSQRFYPWADEIVAVSKGVADDLVQSLALPQERIHVIYEPAFTPDLFEKARESSGHPWLEPKTAPTILGVGRLTKQKDFATLIQAFAEIRKHMQARLIILGEGEERPHLERRVQDLGLEGDVSLPGFADNPYAYMQRADVFVMSSAWEGFGMVLVEALAVGTPVVSTDCPSGPAEILDQGKYGALVPVGDTAALAHAVLGTLHQSPNAAELQKRALDFSLHAVVDRYLEVLQIKDKPSMPPRNRHDLA